MEPGAAPFRRATRSDWLGESMPFLELEGKPDVEDNPREVQGTIVIGSSSQATWRIQRMDLAARHFRVEACDGTARVVPHSVQNVVVLNGRQVPPAGAPLQSGDVIAAGSARFIFLATRDAERPAPPPERPPALLIDRAAKKGYTLRKRVVQIGREIGCNIVLKDPTVSRFHADVRAEGGEYVLYSMGSTGTKINGRSITVPRMLEEGDQIAIGDTVLVFSRQPLPPGIQAVQFEDQGADDGSSRRNTVLATRAVTAELGKLPAGRRRRRPRTSPLKWFTPGKWLRKMHLEPWMVAMAVIVVLMVALMFRG